MSRNLENLDKSKSSSTQLNFPPLPPPHPMQLVGFQAMLRNGFEKANVHGIKSENLTWKQFRLLMHDGYDVFLFHRPTSTMISVGEIVFCERGAEETGPVAIIRVNNPTLVSVETLHSKRSNSEVCILNPHILANMFHTEPPLSETSTLVLPTLSKDSFVSLVPYMAAIQTLFDPDMPIIQDRRPLTDINVLMGAFLTGHLERVVDRLVHVMNNFPKLPWNSLVLSAAEKRQLISPTIPTPLIPGPIPFACQTPDEEQIHYMGFPLFVDTATFCPVSPMARPQPPTPPPTTLSPPATHSPHPCPDCQRIACIRVVDVVPKVRISIAGLARTIRAWFSGRDGFQRLLSQIQPADHSRCIFHDTTRCGPRITTITTIPEALARLIAIISTLHKKFVSAMVLRKTELCVHDADFQHVVVQERDGEAIRQVEFVSVAIKQLQRLHSFAMILCTKEAYNEDEGRVRLDLLRNRLGHNGLRGPQGPQGPQGPPCPYCKGPTHSSPHSMYCHGCDVELCMRCLRLVYEKGAGDGDQSNLGDPELYLQLSYHTGLKMKAGNCCSRCKDCPDRESALAQREAYMEAARLMCDEEREE